MTNKRKNENRYSVEVVSRFSEIAILLGGFSFTGLSVLVTGFQKSNLLSVAFTITALSTILFIMIAVIGSFLRIASMNVSLTEGSPLYKISTLFAFLTYIGITVFFINISVFAFLVSVLIGLVVSIFSIIGLIIVFLTIYHISDQWIPDEWE